MCFVCYVLNCSTYNTLMQISRKFEQLYIEGKGNRWYYYFRNFCRVALSCGFLPAGYVKIIGERFTDLSNNQPMGHYLEALHHTGFYYTYIGVGQIIAAILLLIPRTVTLGALLYFPIILNICILSVAVRFEGSAITAPLMVLANLYLLVWDYDKLKYILAAPGNMPSGPISIKPLRESKIPLKFFAGVFFTIVFAVFLAANAFDIKPRNTISDCKRQCKSNKNPGACEIFCEGIHTKGQPLEKALDEYNRAVKVAEFKQ